MPAIRWLGTARRRIESGLPLQYNSGVPDEIKPNIFWEIHSGLPREGPGDNGSTRRAFLMAAGLPSEPRILDVGCGPGMQTVELAKISGGLITAVDTHQSFLDELEKRAEEAGVGRRVRSVNASMRAMPFAPGSFDLIWSEGAMYMMGFREGLADWKKFLSPHGYIAVTEPCWLKSGIPEEVRTHWAEYPGMTSIERTGYIIADSGFKQIGNFVIPDSAWWNDYYDPLEQRLRMLRGKYRDTSHAVTQIEEAQRELDLHRKYSGLYGYVFFVMQMLD
jgi:ubiquinone/menaquinone biosynthesis C-methylase UbiE